MKAKCNAGSFKLPEEIGLTLLHKTFVVFTYIAKFVIAKDENASRRLWTSAALQCMLQNLSRLTTWRATVWLGMHFQLM